MKNSQKKSQKSQSYDKKDNQNNHLQKNTPTPPPQGHLLQNITDADFSQVNYLAVGSEQVGQRVDNFLLTRLKGLPRSHLYKMMRDGEIRLNKKRIKPHIRLQAGDVLRIAPVRLAQRTQAVAGDELKAGLLARVVYENEGVMVLDKPTGLAVHGGSGETMGVIEVMRQATQKSYLELIHRIDKGTSGLLLIAKKRSTLRAIQEQFRTRKVKKTYLCVVAGKMPLGEQTIDKPLLKYLVNGERRVSVDKQGKRSLTEVSVLGYGVLDGQAVSLVQAQPMTGRTHQIRVHLASIGFAIVGDEKYSPQPTKTRLYLHAWRLSLEGIPPLMAAVPACFYALFPQVNFTDDLI